MNRVSKENYYLDIAETVATRSTCLRKSFGAIIVKNDTIVSTGYNGAPRGRKNCSDLCSCIRDELNIPRGERYELCRSVHSEANAIIAASREQMLGATLYMACLDSKTGEEVMQLLSELNRKGATIVMVTHSKRDASYAHRVVNLLDGVLVDSIENNL